MMKIQASKENFQKYLEISNEINYLLKSIEDKYGFYFSPKYVLESEEFSKLVLMGDKIVDYIFYLIIEHGVKWTYFLLLNKIVDNPPKIDNDSLGRLPHTTIIWLQWYIKSDYYLNSDVYHSLL